MNHNYGVSQLLPTQRQAKQPSAAGTPPTCYCTLYCRRYATGVRTTVSHSGAWAYGEMNGNPKKGTHSWIYDNDRDGDARRGDCRMGSVWIGNSECQSSDYDVCHFRNAVCTDTSLNSSSLALTRSCMVVYFHQLLPLPTPVIINEVGSGSGVIWSYFNGVSAFRLQLKV